MYLDMRVVETWKKHESLVHSARVRTPKILRHDYSRSNDVTRSFDHQWWTWRIEISQFRVNVRSCLKRVIRRSFTISGKVRNIRLVWCFTSVLITHLVFQMFYVSTVSQRINLNDTRRTLIDDANALRVSDRWLTCKYSDTNGNDTDYLPSIQFKLVNWMKKYVGHFCNTTWCFLSAKEAVNHTRWTQNWPSRVVRQNLGLGRSALVDSSIMNAVKESAHTALNILVNFSPTSKGPGDVWTMMSRESSLSPTVERSRLLHRSICRQSRWRPPRDDTFHSSNSRYFLSLSMRAWSRTASSTSAALGWASPPERASEVRRPRPTGNLGNMTRPVPKLRSDVRHSLPLGRSCPEGRRWTSRVLLILVRFGTWLVPLAPLSSSSVPCAGMRLGVSEDREARDMWCVSRRWEAQEVAGARGAPPWTSALWWCALTSSERVTLSSMRKGGWLDKWLNGQTAWTSSWKESRWKSDAANRVVARPGCKLCSLLISCLRATSANCVVTKTFPCPTNRRPAWVLWHICCLTMVPPIEAPHRRQHLECVRQSTSVRHPDAQHATGAHRWWQLPRFDLLVVGKFPGGRVWRFPDSRIVGLTVSNGLTGRYGTHGVICSDCLRFATATVMRTASWRLFKLLTQNLFLGNTFSHLAGDVLYGPDRCLQDCDVVWRSRISYHIFGTLWDDVSAVPRPGLLLMETNPRHSEKCVWEQLWQRCQTIRQAQ